jgi:DNA-binding MarR family transcriptional regulator
VTALLALFDDLIRVEILLWDAVDRRLRRELDLPLGRIQALRAIDTTPDCRVQDVADALAITVGAASKLVDRLEAGKLCTRRANPADRRSSLVETTSEGHETHLRADVIVEAELAQRLTAVAPSDLPRLAGLLATTRQRLIEAG